MGNVPSSILMRQPQQQKVRNHVFYRLEAIWVDKWFLLLSGCGSLNNKRSGMKVLDFLSTRSHLGGDSNGKLSFEIEACR
jgi:hypothetical protein